MAATARILRMSGHPGQGLFHEVFSSCTSSAAVSRPRMIIMCLNKTKWLYTDSPAAATGSRYLMKPGGCTSTSALKSKPETDKGVDLELPLPLPCGADEILSPWMKFVGNHRPPWRFNIQMLFEKVIIDCRFLTFLAIAGSLMGSVLCFVEGCVLTLDSFFLYLQPLLQMSKPIHVVPILIEAIDMFLVGSAMYTFGMALHVMFVGQQRAKSTGTTLSRKFNRQKLSSWIGLESPVQAKSKIGHAVIMILQEQVLEKLKSIPVTNGIDLACFAGAVFLSSVSIFILSRTVAAHAENTL